MKTRHVLPIVVAGTMALAGCFFEEDDPKKSSVRVIHASSDAPPVDVRLGRDREIEGLDYKEGVLFTPNVGSSQMSINADLPGSQRETILTSTYSFRQDRKYDFFVVGNVSNESIKPIVLTDDLETEAGDQTRVRVVHLSPDAQAAARNVDVYLSDADDELDEWLAAGPNFRMGYEDVEGPVLVSAGRYRVRVTLAGTATVVFESGPLSFLSGDDLLIAAVDNTAVDNVAGSGSQSPISLLVADGPEVNEVYDINQRSGVRVVHVARINESISAFVDGELTIASVPFGKTGPSSERNAYATVPPGTQDVAINDSTGEISIAMVNPIVGEGKTIIAYDFKDSKGQIKSLVVNDLVRSVSTQASLRIFHGSRVAALAGPVNIYLLPEDQTSVSGAVPILRDVPFGTESGYLAVEQENYNLFIRDADGNVRIGPVRVGLRDGGVYTFVATDSAAGDRTLLFQLDDNTDPLP
ncbi:DUF4397 domain-containing protein [Marinobacter sp. chi1]|uniref:DUF4397 domain-containing protein n=1 Tax=Marinobacter suaedae TaxID=3057675 RepID=A0ABT8W3U6_9GAMM|nr:DUF4397 domain-containing protein [Marinobacter sp. chi1]MDO3722907.1 DUF4397 domain-containing protein [Marinobacter sp. chi1]